jgi:hypothetical protein
MISRFNRIKRVFGTLALLRTVLLVVGLVGISVLGVALVGSPWPAVVSAAGLLAGWLLRERIVQHGRSLTWALPAALTVYGIVMFFGEKVLGISRGFQLLIIAAVTVVVFDIQFWWLSDPDVYNSDRVGAE